MLDIVASYYYMQFQGKIMKQNRENDKKHIFGPNFGPFAPNSATKAFFQKSGFVIH